MVQLEPFCIRIRRRLRSMAPRAVGLKIIWMKNLEYSIWYCRKRIPVKGLATVSFVLLKLVWNKIFGGNLNFLVKIWLNSYRTNFSEKKYYTILNIYFLVYVKEPKKFSSKIKVSFIGDLIFCIVNFFDQKITNDRQMFYIFWKIKLFSPHGVQRGSLVIANGDVLTPLYPSRADLYPTRTIQEVSKHKKGLK